MIKVTDIKTAVLFDGHQVKIKNTDVRGYKHERYLMPFDIFSIAEDLIEIQVPQETWFQVTAREIFGTHPYCNYITLGAIGVGLWEREPESAFDGEVPEDEYDWDSSDGLWFKWDGVNPFQDRTDYGSCIVSRSEVMK